MNLPPLNALPDISGATTPESQGLTSKIVGAAIGINPLTNKIPSLQSIVVIILGLLLIAAGIFAFKEVRQTVVTTGKAAAKVALV